MVNIPVDTAVILGIITMFIIMYKLYKKGRQDTQSSNATNLNFFNTMRLDSSRNCSKMLGKNRVDNVNSANYKDPEVFKDGMDVKSWLTVIEIFLKNVDKSEWIEIAISHIENKVLRKFKYLEDFANRKSTDFEEFKKS